jgi:lipid-binding SYLF domain-containing protein
MTLTTFAKGVRIMIKYLLLALTVPLFLIGAACSTQETSKVGNDPALEAKARTALQKLFDTTPKAKEIQYQAKAVLVFPDLVKAAFIVGAEGGNGVMFAPDGRVLGYYNASALSYGLQAGGQDFSQAMFFMNDKGLNDLNDADGLSVGMGPSVVIVDEGVAKSLTTTTLQSDVYAFIFGQAGLMAGLGLQGQKITKLSR